MRFRARMTNAKNVATLTNIVTVFQKACNFKQTCLRITPSRLHFTVDEDSLSDSERIWIEVLQANLFESFAVQSLHPRSEVLLQFNLDHFARALRSASNCHDLVIKLAKKQNTPYLTFKIGTMSSTGMTRQIVQDVPVLVRPADDIDAIMPPDLPIPDVNIYMPDIKLLRNIVDRMKAIAQDITVRANMRGELELLVQSEIVTVKTCFNNLDNPLWRDNQTPTHPRPPGAFASAKISARKIAQFIGGACLGDSNNLLLSIGSRNVILFLLHDDLTLTFMLPILS
ncbi:hypothetical protein PTSG_09724 [Salpingoeca rosetta]|uniref:Checkpoint protein n=1 Tax=Salpingoeca rosetta (strain ATCC 50818 / BSB-021) TaxID=946362 RepID=F2UNV5_SALR5|nr:uncharacterized protein PTSG_09724 [Salpingoeca rosetta]EGD79310.1 hypothetical protein PTSG_09724 [Salpingoeca rosetta]|eukprot:XP_004989079.1 hypothetical protein PTSG_09724 [Salpingoeca rosetta]